MVISVSHEDHMRTAWNAAMAATMIAIREGKPMQSFDEWLKEEDAKARKRSPLVLG